MGLRLTTEQARTVAELAKDEHDVVVTRIRRHDDVSVVLPSEASRYAVAPDGTLAREKSAPSHRRRASAVSRPMTPRLEADGA